VLTEQHKALAGKKLGNRQPPARPVPAAAIPARDAEIFRRVMSDEKFRGIAQSHLARELYDRIRDARSETPGQTHGP
jgi:hypothetical protein